MGLKHKIPDSRLQAIVRRVLRINRTEIDIPVIVSTTEGTHTTAVRWAALWSAEVRGYRHSWMWL